LATQGGAQVVQSPSGRACQMNLGAEEASGEWLCFLHADVRMNSDARRALDDVINKDADVVAVWRLGINSDRPLYRLVEFGASLRDRLFGLPYGDQGLLVRKRDFDKVGGYPDVPLMEDVALIKKLRRRNSIRRLKAELAVSARRWEKRGIFRQTVLNTFLITAYLFGVNPNRLAAFYSVP
jgi:rSAM/selenodomain-associated transferase 2